METTTNEDGVTRRCISRPHPKTDEWSQRRVDREGGEERENVNERASTRASETTPTNVSSVRVHASARICTFSIARYMSNVLSKMQEQPDNGRKKLAIPTELAREVWIVARHRGHVSLIAFNQLCEHRLTRLDSINYSGAIDKVVLVFYVIGNVLGSN